MQPRLASWKNKLLNKSGCLRLATSVITSTPSYYMQIAWLQQQRYTLSRMKQTCSP
jgi:hypothetical protein